MDGLSVPADSLTFDLSLTCNIKPPLSGSWIFSFKPFVADIVVFSMTRASILAEQYVFLSYAILLLVVATPNTMIINLLHDPIRFKGIKSLHCSIFCRLLLCCLLMIGEYNNKVTWWMSALQWWQGNTLIIIWHATTISIESSVLHFTRYMCVLSFHCAQFHKNSSMITVH